MLLTQSPSTQKPHDEQYQPKTLAHRKSRLSRCHSPPVQCQQSRMRPHASMCNACLSLSLCELLVKQIHPKTLANAAELAHINSMVLYRVHLQATAPSNVICQTSMPSSAARNFSLQSCWYKQYTGNCMPWMVCVCHSAEMECSNMRGQPNSEQQTDMNC